MFKITFCDLERFATTLKADSVEADTGKIPVDDPTMVSKDGPGLVSSRGFHAQFGRHAFGSVQETVARGGDSSALTFKITFCDLERFPTTLEI